MKKNNFLFIFVFLFCFLASACNNITVSYDVIFYDQDKETILDQQRIEKDQTFTFKGTITNQDKFLGWDINDDGLVDELPSKVTSNLNCVAIYASENLFICRFLDYDNTVLKQETLEINQTPTPPADPTRAKTDEFTYTFIGWDQTIKPITGNTTYKALYSEVVNSYNVTWELDGGIFTDYVPDKVAVYGTTFKSPAVMKDGYKFIKWDKPLEIRGNTTFIAIWEKLDVEENYDLSFILNNEKTAYTINGIGEAKSSSIIIPSSYRLLPVDTINTNAFNNCDNIISITIPTSIKKLSTESIVNCNNLQVITINFDTNSLVIDNKAIYNNPSLQQIKTTTGKEEELISLLGEEYRDLIIDKEEEIDKYILTYTPVDTVNNTSELAKLIDYYSFLSTEKFTVKINFTFDDFNLMTQEVIDKLQPTFSYTVQYGMSLTNNDLTVKLTYGSWATTTSEAGLLYSQKHASNEYKYESNRTNDFDEFKINNNLKTFAVTNTEQLYYVLEKGYAPSFTSETCQAKLIYQKAKAVLRSIIDDRMTDRQKLLAIYEWLINNVTYDQGLLTSMMNNEKDVAKYNGFYLEGVFNDKLAVCDGISKAFTVLARIEGIPCIRIIGDAKNGGLGHAWNKVKLDGKWYVIDATHGGRIINNSYEILVHDLFLVSDALVTKDYDQINYQNIVAMDNDLYYKQMKYTYLNQEHDYYIESIQELTDILHYYVSLGQLNDTIDFLIAFDYQDSLNDEINTALTGTNIASYTNIFENNVCIFINYTTR